MSLYRLDRIRQDGEEAICDLLGPVLFHRWSRARETAIEESETKLGAPVRITKITSSGRLQRLGYALNGQIHRKMEIPH